VALQNYEKNSSAPDNASPVRAKHNV